MNTMSLRGHVVRAKAVVVLCAGDAIIAVDLQLSGLLIFRDVYDRDGDACESNLTLDVN
jgi:hypothetical protein